MKILCDVCGAAAASVFCCADEAALCAACDRRVHGANKLAGKHPRLALLHHPNSNAPATTATTLCDICKEKKGILFCQQDRAMLCRDCDSSIHGSNELTVKHGRFLIAGVGLSLKPMPVPPEAVSEASCNNRISNGNGNNSSSSSISEYLTKMLPGWHVEDFLLDDAAANSAVTMDTECVYNQANEFLTFAGSSSDVAKEQRRKQRSGAAFTVPHFESDCNSSKRHRTSAAAFW